MMQNAEGMVRRRIGSGVTAIGVVTLLGSTAIAADAVRTGPAAYGDWTTDAPGVQREIRVADLPPPYATHSASNGPRLVSRPEGASVAVPTGFTVTRFLSDLKIPRQMRTAPNGDVFLAESGASRIRVIHAAAGATSADTPSIFADHLAHRPYGIAFYPPGSDPQYVYVATEGEVLRYPYRNGDVTARGPAEVIVPNVPVGHHWTRDIVFTPDGKKLLVSVGSGSNDAEDGMGIEERRADILEYNSDGSGMRIYASGIRNPVSLAFDPASGALWTTVNERDGLGDNLPPDYVTRVTPGGFYGWPWYYIGDHRDPRHEGEEPQLASKVLVPDVLLQPHSAPLGFAVYTGKAFPADYRGDLFVAFHGSWNRVQRTGYKIVRIHLEHGKPVGTYEDFLTGFVTKEGNVWGRPVGVDVTADGALLVSDDASGTIWRVAYAGAGAQH
jgi:glucose/arabinose dehydrogenase